MAIVIGEVNELNIKSESVCDFYEKHWKRKIALEEPSFYRWQFTGSPSDAGTDHCIIAIDSVSKEILGVSGLNKRPFFLNGSIKKGAELTTLRVAEKYIGKGVGLRIFQEQLFRYDVLIAMSISEMSLPIIMRSGFRYIRAIPRYVKVFDFDSVEKYAKYNSLAKKLVKQWSLLDAAPFEFQEINCEAMHPPNSILQTQFNHFSRDYAFLQWRYTNHPVFKYKQFVIHSKTDRHGKGVYICLREEMGVESLRLIHILDCFGDEKDMPSAMGFIDRYCAENNIHLADFYCTSARINRQFVSSGWFSINDDLCFQFPHLFHPLEFRDPPTTSLSYWSNSNFIELADISNLYITKQDADLDRPTSTRL